MKLIIKTMAIATLFGIFVSLCILGINIIFYKIPILQNGFDNVMGFKGEEHLKPFEQWWRYLIIWALIFILSIVPIYCSLVFGEDE